MRKEKALSGLLSRLVDLLTEESARNPEFSDRLDALLSELPTKKTATKRSPRATAPEHLPDIHSEWSARGEVDFRLWLCDQPVPVLRALIRAEDWDTTRRTVKWQESEKLAIFMVDRLQARQSRGSAFIGRTGSDEAVRDQSLVDQGPTGDNPESAVTTDTGNDCAPLNLTPASTEAPTSLPDPQIHKPPPP